MGRMMVGMNAGLIGAGAVLSAFLWLAATGRGPTFLPLPRPADQPAAVTLARPAHVATVRRPRLPARTGLVVAAAPRAAAIAVLSRPPAVAPRAPRPVSAPPAAPAPAPAPSSQPQPATPAVPPAQAPTTVAAAQTQVTQTAGAVQSTKEPVTTPPPAALAQSPPAQEPSSPAQGPPASTPPSSHPAHGRGH